MNETADERKRRQTRERVRQYRERSAARIAAGTPQLAAPQREPVDRPSCVNGCDRPAHYLAGKHAGLCDPCRQKVKRATARAAGLCPICKARPPVPGAATCDPCRAKVATWKAANPERALANATANARRRTASGANAANTRRVMDRRRARTAEQITADQARLRPDGTKKCRRGERRPLAEFSINRTTADGLNNLCRDHDDSRYVRTLKAHTAALADEGTDHNGLCEICETAPAEHVDHITPTSLGGTDDIDNLRWACAACNTSRGNDTTWQPPYTAWSTP
ncbi:HNH endonuclease [Micromonospora sp. NPDC005197]|uniref:HNH endonuclease n=1 Tax=Micromonospora sp. NPDC005197 TaxID=3157020 RepID=UPI0033B7A7C5